MYSRWRMLLKTELMIVSIKSFCDNLANEFNSIADERKQLLDKLSNHVIENQIENKTSNLVYICTHNSRRSHFGQIWAAVASRYYNIDQVNTYSGGTEATAFNKNAIDSLRRLGFIINPLNQDLNTKYEVIFNENEKAISCFSKLFNDINNPENDFVAIMTCSDAEENCPFIPGAKMRIGTTYDDPKSFDNTPLQDSKYDERCRQIALETLYVFFKVKEKV